MNYLIYLAILTSYVLAVKTECTKDTDGTTTLCGNSLCDNIGGMCIKEGDYQKCSCNNKYTTQGEVLCGYEKVSRFTSFIAELVIPIGIGHVYAKRFAHGFVKFIIFITLLILTRGLTVKYINQIAIFIFTLMCFIDMIGFFSGLYNDGNNLPFY